MKKVIFIILFAILQTNLFAICVEDRLTGWGMDDFSCGQTCSAPSGQILNCGSGRFMAGGVEIRQEACYGGYYNRQGCGAYAICCTDECSADSVQCSAPNTWNSATCSCEPPPPPPCQLGQMCITYWNDGNGGKDPLKPNEIPAISPNYSGSGYYAMMLFSVDSCSPGCELKGCVKLLMDVPGSCEQHGYCQAGENSCDFPDPNGGSSSSFGSSSSSYDPPDCVCLGCFGGNCMVTCTDGSSRTCRGDFENCSELKNSPTWTECTAPNGGGGSSSSGGGGGSSSAEPSSQANTLDGINALIDTLHHSNELQEVGHGLIKAGNDQNKTFFDDVRGFFGGLLSQVTGIFGNTNNINQNLKNIGNKLDSINAKPRDTTIVNVSGDTINIGGDTNIINIPIDSTIGEPWDTTGGLIGGLMGAFDSTILGVDSLTEWDTIHRGTPDSIGGAIISTFDSGAGKYYKDTLNGWINNGLQNSVLSGQGGNNCPAFLMRAYPMTIGSVTFDLTQNVKLGQYLCQPVIGGRSGWEIGRTILRIIVSIGCMFFLFKCATGTINEE